MSSLFSARRKLVQNQEFILSLALQAKPELILQADIKQLRAAVFVLKAILNGRIFISNTLYQNCKKKSLFRELELLNHSKSLEKTLLSDCKKGGSRANLLKFLPIISLLLECLLE